MLRHFHTICKSPRRYSELCRQLSHLERSSLPLKPESTELTIINGLSSRQVTTFELLNWPNYDFVCWGTDEPRFFVYAPQFLLNSLLLTVTAHVQLFMLGLAHSNSCNHYLAKEHFLYPSRKRLNHPWESYTTTTDMTQRWWLPLSKYTPEPPLLIEIYKIIR